MSAVAIPNCCNELNVLAYALSMDMPNSIGICQTLCQTVLQRKTDRRSIYPDIKQSWFTTVLLQLHSNLLVKL